MKSHALTSAALLAAALLPVVSTAQERSAPIVVTATRTAEIADQTLAPVIVITREDIQRARANDVADLLRLHAGLEISRNGGPGQTTSLFMRGTDSNHTLVMVDGVKINPGTIGGAALQNISPEMIERIEIVKGPRSTLYGSEAIGGVINIITRSEAPGSQAEVAYGQGKHNTRRATADLRHRQGDFRSGVTVSDLQSDGFPTRKTSHINSGHDDTTINAYLGTRLGPVDGEVSYWRASGNTEYLDFSLNPLDQDFENSAASVTLRADPMEPWATTLRLSHITDEIDQNQSSDFAHTRRDQVDWQNDIQVGEAQLFTAGLWLSKEDTNALVFGTGYKEDTTVKAAFVQDDISLGSHRLLLAARVTDHDSFNTHTTWDLEYGYRWRSHTRLTASAGTAFRAPDSTDRFGFGGYPDLDPETSTNVELGLRHQFGPHHRARVNAYQNDIDDLIEYDFTSSMMRNIGKARIRGVELGYDFKLGPWRLQTAATFQDPEDRDTHERLLRRAKRQFTAGLFYDQPRYSLSLDLLASSNRKDFSGGMKAYELLNAALLVRPLPHWEGRLKVENLLDQDYELARGFNSSERAFYAEVRYRYQD